MEDEEVEEQPEGDEEQHAVDCQESDPEPDARAEIQNRVVDCVHIQQEQVSVRPHGDCRESNRIGSMLIHHHTHSRYAGSEVIVLRSDSHR